jgi:hypothetical protein
MRFLLAIPGILCLLSGCVIKSDPGIGRFTGAQTGCANFVVVRENQDGTWLLVVDDHEAGIAGDTTYSEQVGKPGGAEVRLERYSQSGMASTVYCNDVGLSGAKLRESHNAVSGTLKVKAYGYQAAKNFFERRFQIDVELNNVRFEDGHRLDSARVDSVSVGWLAG